MSPNEKLNERFVHMHITIITWMLFALRSATRRLWPDQLSEERGQSTAEYALLLLGVATIALIVVSWASGTGKIAELFDAVVDSIIGKV